jgi:hypothetical protein
VRRAPRPMMHPGEVRELLTYGGVLVGAMLLWELMFAFSGGGTYSILSAISAVGAKVPAIDVDVNGLRFPIAIVLGAIILLLCALGDVDINRKWPGLLVVAGAYGGAIILAAMYDEPIVTRYMSAHGYSRCTAHDHRIGHGKSSIWFDDYVLKPADCATG